MPRHHPQKDDGIPPEAKHLHETRSSYTFEAQMQQLSDFGRGAHRMRSWQREIVRYSIMGFFVLMLIAAAVSAMR